MGIIHTKPSGLLRGFFRAPIWLYRWDLGWLLGGRFLLLTHTGRKSGLPRQVVIEVVSQDERTGTYFVAAAWGGKADWYRNVQKNPSVRVQVGNRSFEARAEQISLEEAEARLWDYAQRHPTAFRELVVLMLSEHLPPDRATCNRVANAVPLIALRPTG